MASYMRAHVTLNQRQGAVASPPHAQPTLGPQRSGRARSAIDARRVFRCRVCGERRGEVEALPAPMTRPLLPLGHCQ